MGAVRGAEFGARTVKVALDRAHRHHQPLGDLRVGQPAGDQGDDLLFPVGSTAAPLAMGRAEFLRS